MLKIFGFLILALGLTQGLSATTVAPNNQFVDVELLLEDDNSAIPQWKVNLILKYTSQQMQMPIMDLQTAYVKGEILIDEVIDPNGNTDYYITTSPGNVLIMEDTNF